MDSETVTRQKESSDNHLIYHKIKISLLLTYLLEIYRGYVGKYILVLITQILITQISLSHLPFCFLKKPLFWTGKPQHTGKQQLLTYTVTAKH